MGGVQEIKVMKMQSIKPIHLLQIACLSLYPLAHLQASGHAVGLADGQMGNSEVGHMHLGAGKVVWQDLPRISQAIEKKELTPPFLLGSI